MTYILKIWEPAGDQRLPSDPGEVDLLVDTLEEQAAGVDSRLPRFVQLLTQRYPSLTGQAARRTPQYEWAWSDGALGPPDAGAVYTLGLNPSRLAEVRPFVLEQARGLGLAVLDPQAGEVFPPDGDTPPVAPPADGAADAKRLPARDVAQLAFDGVGRLLQPLGYKPRKGDRSYRRAFAGGWHNARFVVHDSWEGTDFGLIVYSRIDAVMDLYAAIVAPQQAAKESRDWHAVTLQQKRWLPLTESFIEPNYHLYRSTSSIDVQRALEHLAQQWSLRAAPLLEGVQTVEGLDRSLNTTPIESSMFFNGRGSVAASLLTAYLSRNPRLFALVDELLPTMSECEQKQEALLCIDYIRVHPFPPWRSAE